MDHGHQFRTQSDMEFLFPIQRSVGPGAVGYKQKQLLLSRDRVGIRLLYYTQTGGVFLFASEIKSLLAYPVISHQLDPPGHAETFTFWSPIAPWTAFEGIRELELGHTGLVQNGRLNTQPYWKLTFPEAGTEKIQDESETAERLRGTLILAAKLRFERSDVPVGPYLSGGIDSSISAAIINRYTYAPPKTFSILFEDSEFDEGGYQHAMIDRLGTDHRDIVVGYRDIGDIFPRVV